MQPVAFDIETAGFNKMPTFKGMPFRVNDTIPKDILYAFNGRQTGKTAAMVAFEQRVNKDMANFSKALNKSW